LRPSRPRQASPDETAVRNIVQEEITAWNSGDAAAYSHHFAADGTFTNIRGEFFTGRQPFIEKHDNLFKGPFHGSALKQDIVSLKFIRPDVAVVEVLTSVTGIQKLFPGTNTDEQRPPSHTFVAGHGEGRSRMEDHCVPQHRCEVGSARSPSAIVSPTNPDN
jgi:uncharacterized protein (TIGR02246 family)